MEKIRLIPLVLLLILVGLNTAAFASEKPIGYIGFHSGLPWAIRFNDCTEYNFEGAEKYLWFDRTLDSISCYQFGGKDDSDLRGGVISIYEAPGLDADKFTLNRFSEFIVSKSGWGTFPNVYSISGDCWFRVKEGWIYLNSVDKKFVQYYPGEQDKVAKAAHETYFRTH
ncbi:hypothetical protein [Microbulbifer sp. 2205BS26-8]|uniref:hypothetical protein n=1 Tax=Microbulbifer sp. 2205BS26-8 TaxID=3064386 RepID=UPI00273F1EB2|nr:hypothetical protein [Microbulbifer sp. 2205BS26-8]MDP5208331.1 hypothetical protein [Microbulbifer sp. 2205BS26-8]